MPPPRAVAGRFSAHHVTTVPHCAVTVHLPHADRCRFSLDSSRPSAVSAIGSSISSMHRCTPRPDHGWHPTLHSAFTCYSVQTAVSPRCQLRSCGQTKWRGALSHVAPASSLKPPLPASLSALAVHSPNQSLIAPKGTGYTQDTRSDTVSSGPASLVFAGRRQEYKVATPSAGRQKGCRGGLHPWGGGDVPLPQAVASLKRAASAGCLHMYTRWP